jgi:hypothetical protein
MTGEATHHTMVAGAIRARDVYDAYLASGEVEHQPEDLTPIWRAIRAYYEADPSATSCDALALRASCVENLRDPKRREAVGATLERLVDAPASLPHTRTLARSLRLRRIGERLATSLLSAPDDEATGALIGEYQDAASDGGEEDLPQWDDSTLRPGERGDRVPMLPSSLNSRLRGGLLPGHQLTIFARPEVGKSALALTIAVGAAYKGHRVLYLGNEDPVRDLMMRALAAWTRQTTDAVERDLPAALATAKARGADRLRFASMAPGSLAEIERLVRRYKPRLLIVDQLRNIRTGERGDSLTTTLDKAQQGVRNLGKRYGLSTVTVTQAGDSARNKVVLDDGDVDSSNTGVSAGCDVLLGIGCNDDMRGANQRMLTLCKNKLGGTHGYFSVALDPVSLRFDNAS